MDAITVLTQDHDTLLQLVRKLQQHGSDTPEQRQACKDLVNRMVIVEAAHEALAAEFFWPLVRRQVPGGVGLASAAIAREQGSRQVLSWLDRTAGEDVEFGRLLDSATREVRSHLAYEQEVVWPAVLAAFTPEQLAGLGERMAAARAATPPGYARKACPAESGGLPGCVGRASAFWLRPESLARPAARW
jgi:hypothetical protein